MTYKLQDIWPLVQTALGMARVSESWRGRIDAPEAIHRDAAAAKTLAYQGVEWLTLEVYRLREALERCANLTRNQELSPETIRAVGERVQEIVKEALNGESGA